MYIFDKLKFITIGHNRSIFFSVPAGSLQIDKIEEVVVVQIVLCESIACHENLLFVKLARLKFKTLEMLAWNQPRSMNFCSRMFNKSALSAFWVQEMTQTGFSIEISLHQCCQS